MKTIESSSVLLTIILGLFLILLNSCQPDDYIPLSPIQDEVFSFSDTTLANKNAKLIGCVQNVFSFPYPPLPGFKIDSVNPKRCIVSDNPFDICMLYRDIFTVSCMDLDLLNKYCQAGCPEDFSKISKWIIPDVRESLINNPIPGQNIKDILMNVGFLFAVNKNLLGFQFYDPSLYYNEKGFTLKGDLELPQNVIQGLGIGGKVIKAGTYPVIFNPENGTYSALADVHEFNGETLTPIPDLIIPKLPGKLLP